MPPRPSQFRPPHAKTRVQARRDYDAERTKRLPWRAWYSLPIWCHPIHGLRALQLAKQPLCETCFAKAPPLLTAATIVHHKIAHRGIWARFIDRANLASACKPCHDAELQAAEHQAGADTSPDRP